MAGEYKIKVNNPSRPSDALIEVQPFGQVENGTSFTAMLTKYEVERYSNNPILEIEPTKRKKSDLNDDDKSALAQAEALEESQDAERAALENIEDETPVAGEESIEATDPVELETADIEEGGN